jgi:hypothetical protein
MCVFEFVQNLKLSKIFLKRTRGIQCQCVTSNVAEDSVVDH